MCVNVCVTDCNLAVTRRQRKRRGSVVLTEALQAWRSSQEQSLGAGPLLHFLSQHYCSTEREAEALCELQLLPEETRNPQSDGLKEKRKLTDVV